jgi:hypothetical protein
MREPIAPEADYREKAINALAAGAWHDAYQWAKGWISSGGGAWIVDPWLVYAASAQLHGQPRSAVHSIDLALAHWITEPRDRAILLWVRGGIVRLHLKDPRSALADLTAAAAEAPAWLADDAEASRQASSLEASASRKRKATIGPAPEYRGPGPAGDTMARPISRRLAGARPLVWDAVVPHLGRAGR